MTYRKMPSPNCNERRDGQQPSLIVLHYTGTVTDDEAEQVYMTPGKVSPHYMIYGDGSIVQFVDEGKRAWHAGAGSWGRIDDINSASIGIEVWNTGHEHLFEDFRGDQIAALITLIHDIRTRHDIPDYHILGHSDVSPGRKIDPGEKFPWDQLFESGIGVMPRPVEEDSRLAEHWMDDPSQIVTALKEYGYSSQLDFDVILREFRRHFLPGTLGDWGADMAACTALAALVRQKRKLMFDRSARSGA